MTAAALVAELVAIVGRDTCSPMPTLRAGYEVDWTGRYRGEARCVVRPHDTDEVAAVVAACAAAGAALVPQGGNTGLVGGSVPRPARHRGALAARLDAASTPSTCPPRR